MEARASRRVSAVLPAALAAALRQQKAPRDLGGAAASFVSRTDGSATILLWSTPPAAAGATPVGTATVRWDGAGGATIEEIAWEAPHAETDVWDALEALAGAPRPGESAAGGPRWSRRVSRARTPPIANGRLEQDAPAIEAADLADVAQPPPVGESDRRDALAADDVGVPRWRQRSSNAPVGRDRVCRAVVHITGEPVRAPG